MPSITSLNKTLQSRFKDIECIASTYAVLELTNVRSECKWKNHNISGLTTLCLHPSRGRYFIAIFDQDYNVLFDYKIHSEFHCEVYDTVIVFLAKDATVNIKFNSNADALSFKECIPQYSTYQTPTSYTNVVPVTPVSSAPQYTPADVLSIRSSPNSHTSRASPLVPVITYQQIQQVPQVQQIQQAQQVQVGQKPISSPTHNSYTNIVTIPTNINDSHSQTVTPLTYPTQSIPSQKFKSLPTQNMTQSYPVAGFKSLPQMSNVANPLNLTVNTSPLPVPLNPTRSPMSMTPLTPTLTRTDTMTPVLSNNQYDSKSVNSSLHQSTLSTNSINLSSVNSISPSTSHSGTQRDLQFSTSVSPTSKQDQKQRSQNSSESPDVRRSKSLSLDKLDVYSKSSNSRGARTNDVQTVNQIKKILEDFQITRVEEYPSAPSFQISTLPPPHNHNLLFSTSFLPDYSSSIQVVQATSVDLTYHSEDGSSSPKSITVNPIPLNPNLMFSNTYPATTEVRSGAFNKGIFREGRSASKEFFTQSKPLLRISRNSASTDSRIKNRTASFESSFDEYTPPSSSPLTSNVTSSTEPSEKSSQTNYSPVMHTNARVLHQSPLVETTTAADSSPKLVSSGGRHYDSLLGEDLLEEDKPNNHSLSLMTNQIIASIETYNGTDFDTFFDSNTSSQSKENEPINSSSTINIPSVHLRSNIPSSNTPSSPIVNSSVNIKTSLTSLKSSPSSDSNNEDDKPIYVASMSPAAMHKGLSKSYIDPTLNTIPPPLPVNAPPMRSQPSVLVTRSGSSSNTRSFLSRSYSPTSTIANQSSINERNQTIDNSSIPSTNSTTPMKSTINISTQTSSNTQSTPSITIKPSLMSTNNFIRSDQMYAQSIQQASMSKQNNTSMNIGKSSNCEACTTKIARICLLPCHHVICQSCYAHRSNNLCPLCSCYISNTTQAS